MKIIIYSVEISRLERQRHQAGKDIQQVRMMKDKDGRVMTDEESVLRIWKEYYKGLMNEENERENDRERVNLEVEKISKEEARENMMCDVWRNSNYMHEKNL